MKDLRDRDVPFGVVQERAVPPTQEELIEEPTPTPPANVSEYQLPGGGDQVHPGDLPPAYNPDAYDPTVHNKGKKRGLYTTVAAGILAVGLAAGIGGVKAFGGDSRNTVLFAGYQAAGTRGEALIHGAREVKIHGQWIPIRAEIANLPSLSAHADADEILRWLGGFNRAPKKTFIVHGEPQASQALQTRISTSLGWPCDIAEQDEPQVLS